MAVGCSRAGGGADAAGDAGVDASPYSCSPACGAEQFCSLPNKRCVSAVTGVAAGTSHTCAVHRDGHVSCWGLGALIAPGAPAVTPPLAIEGLRGASAVTVGVQAACALLEGGRVSCWGDFGRGVERATPVVTEDGAPLAGVTALAGGSLAFCGLTAAGTSCWGDNTGGELARPVGLMVPPLTAVLAQPGARRWLAAGVAILVHDGAGELCGWGNNDSGIAPGAHQILERPACAAAPGVVQLSAGDGHACARRGGSAFSCWGSNSGGQLGTGDEAQLAADLPGVMQTLPGELDTIAAGAYHTCALLRSGVAMCWGSNAQGECGVQSSSPHFAPVEVVSLTAPLIGLASGAAAQHTCGILRDGSVQCWGSDIQGQLGAGATTEDPGRFSATPQQVRW